MTDLDSTEIIVSTLGLIGTLGVAYFAHGARKAAREANDAVNHRHRTGTPRIYDIAISNQKAIEGIHEKINSAFIKVDRIDDKVHELTEWKRSYDASPLNTGEGVRKWLEHNEAKIDENTKKIRSLEDTVAKKCNNQ